MENISTNLINPNLGLQTILDVALKYGNGEMTQEEIGNWGQQWIVRQSIPMQEKMIILANLINKYEYPETDAQEMIICELYKNMFFYLYLEGYLGIPIITQEAVTFDNYDLLEPLFGPWIESYAGRDINLFKEMLNRSFELYNLKGMSSIMDNFSDEALNNYSNSNAAMINELNQNADLINNLKDIMVANNPAMKDLVENIKETALGDAKK